MHAQMQLPGADQSLIKQFTRNNFQLAKTRVTLVYPPGSVQTSLLSPLLHLLRDTHSDTGRSGREDGVGQRAGSHGVGEAEAASEQRHRLWHRPGSGCGLAFDAERWSGVR